MGADADAPGFAEYVFAVRVRLDPRSPDVRVEPRTFETTLFRTADPPGEDGWLFFRKPRGFLGYSGRQHRRA